MIGIGRRQLGIDAYIFALRRAQPVTHNFARTVVFIDGDIKQKITIGRPAARAGRVQKLRIRVFAIGKHTDANGEIFRALIVIAPCQHRSIGRGRASGQLEIIAARRFDISINRDLHVFDARVGRAPADQHMLAVFAVACCPAQISNGDGNGGVFFFDAPAHFLKKRTLKLLRRLHNGRRVSVFGFQMRANVTIERVGLFHHRLPVIIAQPSIFVVARVTMMRHAR